MSDRLPAVAQNSLPTCDARTLKPAGETVLPGMMLRWPQIAVTLEGPVLIGNNAVRFSAEPMVQPIFVARRKTGETMGAPEGGFDFLLPKIAADLRGRVHMVWGEGSSRLQRGTDLMIPQVTSLWHAYFFSGKWSQPERIYQANIIKWHAPNASLALDSASNLHVAFVAFEPTGAHVVHAQTKSGKWSSSVAVDYLASYVRLGTGGNNVYLIMTGNDLTSLGDRGSVFVARSISGKPWDARNRVQLSGSQPAMDAWVFSAPDRTVHLIWLQSLQSGMVVDVIRHARSLDEGLTWSIVGDFPIPGDMNNSIAAMDACGAIHVVIEITRNGKMLPELFYARWQGQWIAEKLPGADEVTIGPAIATTPSGEVLIGWNTVGLLPGLNRPEHFYRFVQFGRE